MVSTCPYQNLSSHFVAISIRYSHQSPISQFMFHQMFDFVYDMFTSILFILQTLRICCDSGQCIFSVVPSS